ncbi:hypothetical protein EBT31_14425, partial [bacterium]|nr:hypothetical protein [bacterium]
RGAVEDARGRLRLAQISQQLSDKELKRNTLRNSFKAIKTYKEARKDLIENYRNKLTNLTNSYKQQTLERKTKYANTVRARTQSRLFDRAGQVLDAKKLRREAAILKLRNRAQTVGMLPAFGRKGTKTYLRRLSRSWRRDRF